MNQIDKLECYICHEVVDSSTMTPIAPDPFAPGGCPECIEIITKQMEKDRAEQKI